MCHLLPRNLFIVFRKKVFGKGIKKQVTTEKSILDIVFPDLFRFCLSFYCMFPLQRNEGCGLSCVCIYQRLAVSLC